MTTLLVMWRSEADPFSGSAGGFRRTERLGSSRRFRMIGNCKWQCNVIIQHKVYLDSQLLTVESHNAIMQDGVANAWGQAMMCCNLRLTRNGTG